MNKKTKIAGLIGASLALILGSLTFVKISKSEPVWKFVPGSVEDGVTFKAVRHGFREKEYTIKLCHIEAPDVSTPSGLESKKLLQKFLENSEELKIQFNTMYRNMSNVNGEAYVVKNNGDEVSLIRELIKSEKVEINGEKISPLLPGFDFCLMSKKEIDFVQKAYEVQLDKELQESKK